MSIKPRFSLFVLLLLCAVAASSIFGVLWLRTNIVILSDVSGTLVSRTGERYPLNRWFRLPAFDPSVFYHDDFEDPNSTIRMKPYSVLETTQGNFKADVSLWRYEGSSNEQFRVELKAKPGEQLK